MSTGRMPNCISTPVPSNLLHYHNKYACGKQIDKNSRHDRKREGLEKKVQLIHI